AVSEVDQKTRQSQKSHWARDFSRVKEEGVWKIWHYAPAAEGLAAALAAAKTEAERGALLTAEKELVTTELRQALVAQGFAKEKAGEYPEALALYELARTVAQQIGDQAGVGDALNNLGLASAAQGNPARAVEFFQQSLKQYEALGEKEGMANALGNMALIYRAQANYPQALELQQKALA